jgi:hypothetical protein
MSSTMSSSSIVKPLAELSKVNESSFKRRVTNEIKELSKMGAYIDLEYNIRELILFNMFNDSGKHGKLYL